VCVCFGWVFVALAFDCFLTLFACCCLYFSSFFFFFLLGILSLWLFFCSLCVFCFSVVCVFFFGCGGCCMFFLY